MLTQSLMESFFYDNVRRGLFHKFEYGKVQFYRFLLFCVKKNDYTVQKSRIWDGSIFLKSNPMIIIIQ